MKEPATRETTYNRIKRIASEKGLSLQEVCREAKVDRSSIEHWKHEEPKTIKTIIELEEAVKRLPSKKRKVAKK